MRSSPVSVRSVSITQFAEDYCCRRGIKATPISSARRFAGVCGDLPVSEITQTLLDEFAVRASKRWSASTIAGTQKDLRTLVNDATGVMLKVTQKVPRPEPEPTPLDDIDALWPHLANWSRQFVVLSFWTALRCSDLIRLQQALPLPDRNVIRWTASKTKLRQRWPVVPWLKPWLRKIPLPYGNDVTHSGRIVRAEFDRCSDLAGVDRVMPSTIRDLALTEWTRTGSAGPIMHGCGLGVLDHYADPLTVIEGAISRLRLPKRFGAHEASDEDAMLLAFRRLDGSARKLISETAQRLAQ